MSAPSDEQTKSGYKFGYSKATLSSHASRTIHTDAGFAIPHVQPHHQVLDVGSGPGTITIGFAALTDPSKGGGVTGVDIGASTVESARGLARTKGLPEGAVTFRQANVLEGLPFPDGSFDVVFTSQTLSHLAPVPDAPVEALKEMRRVLRPGGVLAARDAASLSYHPFREEIQRSLTDRLYAVVGNDGPCGVHMQAYLRAAGFDTASPEKLQIGGSATVVAGREKVGWWRDTMGGRLAKGDPFRESWLKFGISEEECDATKELMDRWAESADAWYGVLQSEILAWK